MFQLIGMSGRAIYLINNTGVVTDHRGAAGDDTAFHTNGMGTSLAEQRPVTIEREEHFCVRSTAITCPGAPVFGAEGTVISARDALPTDEGA